MCYVLNDSQKTKKIFEQGIIRKKYEVYNDSILFFLRNTKRSIKS